jgi:hypothetical protein
MKLFDLQTDDINAAAVSRREHRAEINNRLVLSIESNLAAAFYRLKKPAMIFFLRCRIRHSETLTEIASL